MNTTVAIIGGGAAGLAAALEAARAGARVRVYEANDRVGKSILATGNGRCNFSNSDPRAGAYRNVAFVERAFDQADAEGLTTLGLFEGLGLAWREESQGRLYPATNKATTVLDVLRAGLAGWGVQERCGMRVRRFDRAEGRWEIAFEDGSTDRVDAMVIAVGGRIAPSLVPAGHPFATPQATLGPLRTKVDRIKGLNNVRVRCAIELVREGEALAREVGEVLFRDYGVSGIAVFNLSRYAREGDVLRLDLLDGLSDLAPTRLLAERARLVGSLRAPGGSLTALDVTEGLLLPSIARCALKAAQVKPDGAWDDGVAAQAGRALSRFELDVLGIGDARQCQVHRGGLAVEAFDPRTMESRNAKGLFAAGEALDVDAACGGFNLHWAWVSGMLAGRHAAKEGMAR